MDGDHVVVNKQVQVGLRHGVGLENLTTELLLAIFELVDYITIGRIAQVCRRWNELAESISTRDIFGPDIRLAKYSHNQLSPRCLQRHTEAVLAVVATRNGFCSGCGDSSVAVWNTDGILLSVLDGNKSEVLSLAATLDGSFFSGSQDGVLSIWVPPCTTPTKQIDLGHHAAIECLIFNDDRLYGSHGDRIYVWTDVGEILQTLEGNGQTSALAVANPPVEIAHERDGSQNNATSQNETHALSGVMLISGAYSGRYRVYTDEGVLLERGTNSGREITAIASSPCSTLVFMTDFLSSERCEINVSTLHREGPHLRLLHVIAQPGPISSLVTYGNKLYTGAWDNCVRVFEYTRTAISEHTESTKISEMKPKELNNHTAAVLCLAISSNGRLFSGGKDKSICIW